MVQKNNRVEKSTRLFFCYENTNIYDKNDVIANDGMFAKSMS